jgi:hypothetical protein
MASGKGKPFDERMNNSEKLYHSSFAGFLKKGNTYTVSYEITPMCDDLMLFEPVKNYNVSKLKIEHIRAEHSR